MKWIEGRLTREPGSTTSGRLCLPGRDGLHCGERLEINVGGAWARGRVENDHQGWYWTNNQISVPLRRGMEARVWDGREWPAIPRQPEPARTQPGSWEARCR